MYVVNVYQTTSTKSVEIQRVKPVQSISQGLSITILIAVNIC